MRSFPPISPEVSSRDNLLTHTAIALFIRSQLKISEKQSEHPNSFHLYQDLLCIKLVGFCVDQEERCPIRVNHLLNLIEALNYQRVHARRFGKN